MIRCIMRRYIIQLLQWMQIENINIFWVLDNIILGIIMA